MYVSGPVTHWLGKKVNRQLVNLTILVKFSQLILMKIIKIVATRCQILRLKCIKFNFGWGFAPDSARGAYSAPPDPRSWI